MANNTTEQAAAATPPVAPMPAPPIVPAPVEGVHYLTDISDKLSALGTRLTPAVKIASAAYDILNPLSTSAPAQEIKKQVTNKAVETLTDANKFADTVQSIPQTGELEIEPLETAAKSAVKTIAGKFEKVGGIEQRGSTTFGRHGGSFGTTVDRTFETMRAQEATASSVDIKAEGPEWDRTHSAIDANGKKVGSVGYKTDPAGRAQIYGSVVDPALRGKGIGQKTYRSVFAEAQANGASSITSDSTNTSPEANRVWEKLREKGLPVENIIHPNGKPGYQINFDKPSNQKVDLSATYGDTGKLVRGPEKPAISSQQKMVEDAGLVYKGELTKGSGVHMFEHPDHPGKTAALDAADMTPAAVTEKMAAKLKDFEIKPTTKKIKGII